MKSLKILNNITFFIILFLMGCSSFEIVQQPENTHPIRTVYSDLFPQSLSRSEYYYELGKNYFKTTEWDAAIQMFRLSLLHDPKNSLARFNLAKAYILNQQDNLAYIQLDTYFATNKNLLKWTDYELQLVSDSYMRLKSFNQAVMLNQNYYNATQKRLALWNLYNIFFQTQQFQKSLDILHFLKALPENSFKIQLAFADVHCQISANQKCLDSLEAADKVRPLNHLVMRKKIQTLFVMERWDEVVLTSRKYNKYHAFDYKISQMTALSALKIKDYDTALIEYDKQKNQQQTENLIDFDDINLKTAEVLFFKKNYNNSEEIFTEIYKNTGSEQALYYLAQINIAEGQIEEGTKKIDLFPLSSPFYIQTQLQIAELDWNNKNKDLALNRLRRAHLQRTDSAQFYALYAQYLIGTENYVEAVSILEKANSAFPKNDQLKILSAYTHFQLGNQKKFNNDIQAAIALNPKNSEIYAVLSELWYQNNKSYSELQYLAEKALAFKTQNKNVKPLLAWSLMKQKKVTESVAMFETYYDQNSNNLFYKKSLEQIYSGETLVQKWNQFELNSSENKAIQLRLPASLDP